MRTNEAIKTSPTKIGDEHLFLQVRQILYQSILSIINT